MMTTLTIPASVTTINPSAFFNCVSLAYLYFSSGSVLTMIDEYAFANCSVLSQCRLPASLVTIGAAAFQGDYSLVRMVLPKNLTTIGAGAFIDCTQMNLTYFPHQVTTVGAYAFKGCYATQAYFSDSDASGQGAFATNWDYVGTSYTLNSGSALLKKNYNKPNLNYNSDYIYIQADPSVTAPNYDVNIIAYVGTDNSAAAGSVNLDASGRGVVPATIVDVDDPTIQHRVIGVNSYAFQNHTELGNVVFGSSSAPSNIATSKSWISLRPAASKRSALMLLPTVVQPITSRSPLFIFPLRSPTSALTLSRISPSCKASFSKMRPQLLFIRIWPRLATTPSSMLAARPIPPAAPRRLP
jgi:hypothetical protein